MESSIKKSKSILKEIEITFKKLKFNPKKFTWTSSIEYKRLFWSECLLAPRTSCERLVTVIEFQNLLLIDIQLFSKSELTPY